MVERVRLLLAVLTVGTQAFVTTTALLGCAWLLGIKKPLRYFVSVFSARSLHFAWFISIGATLGSLYMSEVAHYIPCELCWFQRTVMYPFAIALGIATFKPDAPRWLVVLPWPVIGTIIAAVRADSPTIKWAAFVTFTAVVAALVPLKKATVALPLITQAAVGAVVATYHYQLEAFPDQEKITACSRDIPCEIRLFAEFGYISLPLMSLTAFAAITIFVLIHRASAKGEPGVFNTDTGEITQ